jgi:NTP pyrophosphatase (non-canonical NTP hydrolase)
MKAFQKAVTDELTFARRKYPKDFTDAHQAYAYLKEEVDEFWDEVKRKNSEHTKPEIQLRMLKELIQVAAMAQRTAEDLGLIDNSTNL